MESDGQKLYSVLTRTEVREKMMKEIDQISEFFSLSKSDATVILIRLRWNSFQASDRLGDDKEKFLAELGLISNLNESNSSSENPEMTYSDGDGDVLVSTPFCSHKFSTTCWEDYLSESLKKKSEETGVLISCPKQDCVASVGPDTIVKLTEPVKVMYESYIIGSFMKRNNDSIKWCPARGCNYAIELHEDVDESNDFGVVCLCGHIFCWRCQLESHRPVTCNNASLWWNKLLDQARTIAWIAKNTKPCPSCNTPVRKEDDSELRLITCICSCTFCWVCLRSEEEHNGKWNCKPFALPPMSQDNADSFSNLGTHILHLDLWEACHVAMEKAKSDLKLIEQKTIPKLAETYLFGEQDTRALRETWMLIVQCRQLLKWSCVFGFFITEYQSAKKHYLHHILRKADAVLVTHEEAVYVLMNKALSDEAFSCFSHKLETLTTNTGSYFHEFVKNLEDGLSEIKVDVYDNEPVRYWFCDRCTFQNRWVDKECKMCYVPPKPPSSPSPSHVAFDNSNTSSSHHQQVPNMPNIPSAGDEDIKP